MGYRIQSCHMLKWEDQDLVQDQFVQFPKEQEWFYVLFLQREILVVGLNLEI